VKQQGAARLREGQVGYDCRLLIARLSCFSKRLVGSISSKYVLDLDGDQFGDFCRDHRH
jgi:hypothetical protein